MGGLVHTGAVVRRDLELDLLAVRKRAEARSVDLRLVDEDVTLLAIDSDEAEALVGIVPFDRAGGLFLGAAGSTAAARRHTALAAVHLPNCLPGSLLDSHGCDRLPG